jgi:hypothetical protein
VPATITSRNARFQQWQALLTNRTKRQRAGEFLVQRVRPITMAVEHGWAIRALVHPTTGVRSQWSPRSAGPAGSHSGRRQAAHSGLRPADQSRKRRHAAAGSQLPAEQTRIRDDQTVLVHFDVTDEDAVE